MWILDGLKILKGSGDTAVITEDDTLSFAELWRRSELIARDIDSTGKNSPVVIYVDKNANYLPTMIAALKTGRAYVPVDTMYPVDRLITIVNAVDACVVYNYSGIDIPIASRDLDYVTALYSGSVNEDIPESRYVGNDDLCYILFTSGSTGQPKGVPIKKSNILNLIEFLTPYCSYPGNILIPACFSFDSSTIPLHVFLPRGNAVVFYRKSLVQKPQELVEFIIKNEIAGFTATTSFVEILRKSPDFNHRSLPSLRQIAFGGEVLEKDTVRYLRSEFQDLEMINACGPTETTVEYSRCRLSDDMILSDEPFPIGAVMAEAEYRIENDGVICSEGEIGELVVISRSVSDGYLNDPERTAEKFFRHSDGRMGYYTGDLVYEKGGMLYFAGRKDFQIKLGGYRIELEDISSNINKIPFVTRGIALPCYGDNGKVSYISAFVTLTDDRVGKSVIKNVVDIKAALQKLVPKYMLPQKVFILNEFPLNINGKIDTKALAAEYGIKLH